MKSKTLNCRDFRLNYLFETSCSFSKYTNKKYKDNYKLLSSFFKFTKIKINVSQLIVHGKQDEKKPAMNVSQLLSSYDNKQNEIKL